MIINERSPAMPDRSVAKAGAGSATTRTTQTTTTIVETWAKLLEHQSSVQSAPAELIAGEAESARAPRRNEALENTVTAMGSTVSATTPNYQLRFNVKLPAAST
ncbi:uncharacterized protein LOC126577497 [Anopheles aquasalis]|uniref:uncharacterized protein LOC126577497 n=1 Tax=Anopheles aquasalis TaxID=42839 RepID=UPI00215A1114|nr:uncharacterized protein LOC126577497 [Anopheles aquasalis]